jgi:hypothetical protein
MREWLEQSEKSLLNVIENLLPADSTPNEQQIESEIVEQGEFLGESYSVLNLSIIGSGE